MATNFKQEGDVLTLTWATTSPLTGAPVAKCAAKATGGIIGVALNGTATAGESVDVATKGVFNVSIVAGGAMAVGSYVYAAVAGDVEVCTVTLSETNTGLLFGQLLETISGAATVTKKVKLLQPAHL